jgi:hypothetical protein
MQTAQFARIAQNHAVPVSEFVRKFRLQAECTIWRRKRCELETSCKKQWSVCDVIAEKWTVLVTMKSHGWFG